MRTQSAGARPGNFWLAKLAAMIRRFSICGTTKPKPSSGWPICGAATAEADDRAAGVFDVGQLGGELGGRVAEQLSGGVGGGGEDEGVEGEWGVGSAEWGVAEGERCDKFELPVVVRRCAVMRVTRVLSWIALGGQTAARALISAAMPFLGAAKRP